MVKLHLKFTFKQGNKVVKVEFLGPIGKKDMEIDAKNLQEIKEILKKEEDLKEWLEICSVAVNDKIVNSLDVKIMSNDKISLLPPVCGG